MSGKAYIFDSPQPILDALNEAYSLDERFAARREKAKARFDARCKEWFAACDAMIAEAQAKKIRERERK